MNVTGGTLRWRVKKRRDHAKWIWNYGVLLRFDDEEDGALRLWVTKPEVEKYVADGWRRLSWHEHLYRRAVDYVGLWNT